MKYGLYTLGCLFLFFSLWQCKSSKPKHAAEFDDQLYLAFYNVENLFDTLDDATTLDEDFTPTGRQKWTSQRYFRKLDNLAKVIEGMHMPILLGLCEVENATVLRDLCGHGPLKAADYDFVHFESTDRRGIDVALLYRKAYFQPKQQEYIRFEFPKDILLENEEGYTSRDILKVEGEFFNKAPLTIFVNHWPSRRGGLTASEPKRLFVASQLRQQINQLSPQTPILIMGDFNDETDNKSIATVLDSSTPLYNCLAQLDEQGKGSYNFRGNWNMLDQMIVSKNLLEKKGKVQTHSPAIFDAEWLMYKDKKRGPRPNRTYGGPNYYGGYSDHLPVYMVVEFR